MPSDPRSKTRSSKSSSRLSSSSSSSKLKSSTKIRQAEAQKLYLSSLPTHTGYLAKPLLSVSKSLSTNDFDFLGLSPLQTLAFLLALIFLLLHLVIPSFILSQLSSLVTLLIPLQNTLNSINLDLNKGPGSSRDTAQWCTYWLVYVGFSTIRGLISAFRPGWRGVFELGRSVGLVMVGGPWFGKDIMVCYCFIPHGFGLEFDLIGLWGVESIKGEE